MYTNILGEQLLRHSNNTEYTIEYTTVYVSSYYYMCPRTSIYVC
jgi:hypothetical protein